MEIRKASISNLQSLNVGVGHTRWATHGGVTEANTHPHISMDGDVAVVHNGIVENFIELKRELAGEGVEFKSETDTEMIVHLVARYLKQNMSLEAACHTAFAQLRGSEAIVVVSVREPDKLIAARLGNAGGVVVGLGQGEGFVASDVPSVLEHTRQFLFLEDREVVVVTVNGSVVCKLNSDVIQKQIHTIAWDPISAEKGEYRHFMQKEMFEKPCTAAAATGAWKAGWTFAPLTICCAARHQRQPVNGQAQQRSPLGYLLQSTARRASLLSLGVHAPAFVER